MSFLLLQFNFKQYELSKALLEICICTEICYLQEFLSCVTKSFTSVSESIYRHPS